MKRYHLFKKRPSYQYPLLKIFLILFIPLNIIGVSPDTIWTKYYGGNQDEEGYDVIQTTDRGYLIAGYTRSFGVGGADVYLIKTDSLGDTIWTKTYGGINDDFGRSVKETFDGGYIIGGYTYSFGVPGSDVYLLKTDSLGNVLWTKTFGGDSIDKAYSIDVTFDKGYIIAGYTNSFGSGNLDVYVIKTDSLGNTQWFKTFEEINKDIGYSVQQTSDSGYIVSGTTNLSGNSDDIYLIKINPSGDIVWAKTLGDSMLAECGLSVCQTLDGGYITAGWESWLFPSLDLYVIKTDENGNELWGGYFYSDSVWFNESGYSVQQTSDSGYIVSGYQYVSDELQEDILLIKYNKNGHREWTKNIGGTNNEIGYSIVQTTEYSYIISGFTSSFGSSGKDVYLTKINPLKLISPDGGEYFYSNTEEKIVWETECPNVYSYRIILSLDGGINYTDTIVDNVSSDSISWNWQIPFINNKNCRIKIQMFDSSNNIIAEDESNNDFEIWKGYGLASSQFPISKHDIYHTGRSSYFGSLSDSIRWHFQTGGSILSSPTIDPDGIIYFTSGNDSLYAISIDGERLWSVHIFSTQSSPTIRMDSTIYVGDATGKLWVFYKDGSYRWSYDCGNSINSSPVVIPDGTIYVTSTNDSIYAINVDGTLKWKTGVNSGILTSLVISLEGYIYLGTANGRLYCLKPDGHIFWYVSTGAKIISSPSIDTTSGIVYFGSCNGKLYAFDKYGIKKWEFQTNDTIVSSPGINIDGSIIFGSNDNHIYCLHPDGTVKWDFETGGKVKSSPVIDAKRNLYIGSDDSILYCLNADNGTSIWQKKLSGKINSLSLGANGNLYAGCSDGNLYSVGSNNPILLISPNGGENWGKQTIQKILWTTSEKFDFMKLFYSINGGIDWNLISDSLKNTGLFNWLLPDTTSSSCLVKIIGILNTGDSLVDESDNTFIISEAGIGEKNPNQNMLVFINPLIFKKNCILKLSLQKKSKVRISLYDISGREIKEFLNSEMEKGYHSIQLLLKGQSENPLATGVYFLRIEEGKTNLFKKIIILL